MIKVQELIKIYGKQQNSFAALSGVNLAVDDGATLAIVGKSGSGKSTLMHIMSGLDHPTSGTVVVNGQDIHKLKSKKLDAFRAKEMSFIFQAFFVEPNQTCYQNVALPLEIAGVALSQRKKLVEQALHKVDLADKIDAKAVNLSGGQKQRLAIARAIVNKPKLIFADEPTGNLDSTTGETIIQTLFELNRKLGSTLVIVTHDDELANRCDVVVKLKDGQVVETINHKNLRTKSKIRGKQ